MKLICVIFVLFVALVTSAQCQKIAEDWGNNVSCNLFQDFIGKVYQQETNDTKLCTECNENLQTLDQYRSIGDIVCEKFKYSPEVSAKTLGAAFREEGWINPIAFPSYTEQDYWSHRTGEEPKTVHTSAGTSFATLVKDTQNGTIDVVNAIWKGYGVTRYYINLYYDPHTEESRTIVKMNVTQIEWDCSGDR